MDIFLSTNEHIVTVQSMMGADSRIYLRADSRIYLLELPGYQVNDTRPRWWLFNISSILHYTNSLS